MCDCAQLGIYARRPADFVYIGYGILFLKTYFSAQYLHFTFVKYDLSYHLWEVIYSYISMKKRLVFLCFKLTSNFSFSFPVSLLISQVSIIFRCISACSSGRRRASFIPLYRQVALTLHTLRPDQEELNGPDLFHKQLHTFTITTLFPVTLSL